jgi:hypothetical protein
MRASGQNPSTVARAVTRLATDKRPAQGVITKTTEEEVTIGEHRHLVLQALCRGSVRRCQGEVCAPCNAYIIAAPRSGIPEALPTIFPGCRVERWQPVKKELRGKVKEAAEFVVAWFEKNPDDLLRFNAVQRAIGTDTRSTSGQTCVATPTSSRHSTTTRSPRRGG